MSSGTLCGWEVEVEKEMRNSWGFSVHNFTVCVHTCLSVCSLSAADSCFRRKDSNTAPSVLGWQHQQQFVLLFSLHFFLCVPWNSTSRGCHLWSSKHTHNSPIDGFNPSHLKNKETFSIDKTWMTFINKKKKKRQLLLSCRFLIFIFLNRHMLHAVAHASHAVRPLSRSHCA